MNNSGYEDVREGIAENINVKYNTKLNYENIVMTCGAAGGLNIILKTILTLFPQKPKREHNLEKIFPVYIILYKNLKIW